MKIPSVPESNLVEPSFNLTPRWRVFFVTLINQLQTFLSRDGVVAFYQELDTADIAAIPSGKRNGYLVRNTDTGDVFIGTNDTFEQIN